MQFFAFFSLIFQFQSTVRFLLPLHLTFSVFPHQATLHACHSHSLFIYSVFFEDFLYILLFSAEYESLSVFRSSYQNLFYHSITFFFTIFFFIYTIQLFRFQVLHEAASILFSLLIMFCLPVFELSFFNFFLYFVDFYFLMHHVEFYTLTFHYATFSLSLSSAMFMFLCITLYTFHFIKNSFFRFHFHFLFHCVNLSPLSNFICSSQWRASPWR